MLLDTHAMIWWLEGSAAFSAPLRRQIEAMAPGEVYVSAASIYEIELKRKIGRLPYFADTAMSHMADQGFAELPITARHADLAGRFALTHKDPWDRLIAAQSILEGLTVITRDPAIAALGARTLW